MRHRARIVLSVGRIVGIIERRVEHGSPVRPVEEIGDEHRVSFGSDALSEITNHGTQARRIMPQQYSRMGTSRRMNENRVANAVRRLDVGVHVDHPLFSIRGRAGRSGG